MNLIRWLIKHRSWPSPLQRDFMSRNPKRQARVQAVADRINAEIEAEGYEEDCTWCGGEWYLTECDDPIQCCDPRCDGTWHPCVACNGTGRASEQWCW